MLPWDSSICSEMGSAAAALGLPGGRMSLRLLPTVGAGGSTSSAPLLIARSLEFGRCGGCKQLAATMCQRKFFGAGWMSRRQVHSRLPPAPAPSPRSRRRANPPAPVTGGAPRGSARPLSGREARPLAAPAVAGAAIPTLGNGASGSYCRLEFGPGPPLSG